MAMTKKFLGAFMVGEFPVYPISRALHLSQYVHQHTKFPTCKKIMRMRKGVRTTAMALSTVNEPAVLKAVADQKVAALNVTALVTLRNSEMGNIEDMMPQLFDAFNSAQRFIVLQLVSTEIDPRKNLALFLKPKSFLFHFVNPFYN